MNPDSQFQPPQPGPVPGMPVDPNLPPAGPQFQPQPTQPAQIQVPGVQQPQPPQAPSPYPQQPGPGISASEQKKRRPWVLIISLIVVTLAFFSSSGFAFWAYAEMQDYKNNVEEKVAVAVNDAVKVTEETKEKEFLERSKSPHKTYKSPATYGAVEITYPKTWAAAVDEQGSQAQVNGYFHPDYVPGPKSGTAFALRLEVIRQPYDKVLGSYESDAKKGIVKVSPYKAKRVPSVLGARVHGEIDKGINGSAVLFPLRDKTIRISTYSYQSFGADFEKIILEKLIYTP